MEWCQIKLHIRGQCGLCACRGCDECKVWRPRPPPPPSPTRPPSPPPLPPPPSPPDACSLEGKAELPDDGLCNGLGLDDEHICRTSYQIERKEGESVQVPCAWEVEMASIELASGEPSYEIAQASCVQATCSSPPSLPRVPLHSAPSPLPALQDVAKVAPSSILPHVDTPDSAATLPNREPLDDPDLPELTAARAIPLILGALALGLLAAIVLVLLLTRRPKPAGALVPCQQTPDPFGPPGRPIGFLVRSADEIDHDVPRVRQQSPRATTSRIPTATRKTRTSWSASYR